IEGACVDQYFRVPLVAPRIAPPPTPVAIDEATFAVLAAIDTSGAPVEALLERTSAVVVPSSRLQRPSPVDLVNLRLVAAGSMASVDLGWADVPSSQRGDVARVWLYMLHAYGIAMTRDELDTAVRWDHEDPVDAPERERDRRIRRLQGAANPFVGGAPS